MNEDFLINIKSIKRAIDTRKLVIFAGAGISIDSGVPSWHALIKQIKSELNLPLKEEDYLRIAQMFYNSRGERDYLDTLRSTLKYGNTNYNPIHEAIFQLNPEHVITTNYDNLLEQIIKRKALPFSVVNSDRSFPYSTNTSLLVKMHGDFEVPSVLVLKEDDYLNYSSKHPLIEAFIKAVFASRVVLFVGYSFSDINLKLIVQSVKSILGKNFQSAYLLTLEENIHPLQRQYFQSKGIRILAYDDANDDTGNFIDNYLRGDNAFRYNFFKRERQLSEKGQKLYNLLIFISAYDTFSEEVKNLNVIEQIYYSLDRFNELDFLPASFIANLFPFNTEKDRYSSLNIRKFNFLIRNSQITDLFYNHFDAVHKKLSIGFLKNLSHDTDELQNKFEKIIRVLNENLILAIYREGDNPDSLGNRGWNSEGVDIFLNKPYEDNIITIFYDQFRFKGVVQKVEETVITQTSNVKDDLRLAYMHYKLGNFTTCFHMLDEIANKAWQRREYISYFLAKYNTNNLRNFVKFNFNQKISEDKKKEILEKIENINLDELLIQLYKHNTPEYLLLKNIKDNKVLTEIKSTIEKGHEQVHKEYKILSRGGMVGGDNDINNIVIELSRLISFYCNNAIIFDEFLEFTDICKKAIEAFFISYVTSRDYRNKLTSFSEFHLTVIVFYCSADYLNKIFTKYKVKELEISEESLEKFISMLNNYLTSYFSVGSVFGRIVRRGIDTSNLFFQELSSRIFANFFTLLSTILLKRNENLITNLLDFLEVENFLRYIDIVYLSDFMFKNPHLFKKDDLKRLIRISAAQKKYFRKKDFLSALLFIKEKYHEDFEVSDSEIFYSIMSHIQDNSKNQDFLPLLCHIFKKEYKSTLKRMIRKQLQQDFTRELYIEACFRNIIDYSEFFDIYLLYINDKKGNEEIIYRNSQPNLNNYYFNSFIEFILLKKIVLTKEQKEKFSNLTLYQQFLLAPDDFDYNNFDARWVLIWNSELYHMKFAQVNCIKEKINQSLSNHYDSKLAKLYFKYYNTIS